MTEGTVLAIGQAFAALYGVVGGSFLAAAIVRLPEDRSLLVPSSCPRCGHRIGARDLVPVLSWLALRGRCRHCAARIPPLYPLVEALTGVLAWLTFRHVFGAVADLDLAHAVAWVSQLTFLSLILVAAATDIKHRIIPHETSIYAAPIGIALHGLLQVLGYQGFFAVGFVPSVLGAAMWGGGFALIAWLWVVVRGHVGLGGGDVRLALMYGAFLGPHGALWALCLGSIVGSVVGLIALPFVGARGYLPFGPSLALGGVAYTLFGDLPVAEWLADFLYG